MKLLMRRRVFIEKSLLASAGLMLVANEAQLANNVQEDVVSGELENNFLTPPDTARPWCFYMWMNGNITKEGITADLEAMKRMGIGGAINFNSAVGIPRGPIDYASEEWMDATLHTIKEANRLGLEMSLHNSPGYSGTGGPWVTPEMSMQQLVWTETLVSQGKIHRQLAKPYAKMDYYRDAFVIAYPSLPVEKTLMKDKLLKVTANGIETDKKILTDGNPETKLRLELAGKEAVLQLEFAEPFEARAITLLRKPEIPRDLFDGPRDHPPVFRLEYSEDSINFNFIGNVRPPEMREMDTPVSLSFNAVKAKYYRLVATTASWISDVELYNGPRLVGWPAKTSHTHGDSGGQMPAIENELIINPARVIDITDKMDASGCLLWDVPSGNWTVLRIGHTTTGEECAAHPDAGKGLEIDKFRKEALDFHFTSFLDKMIDRLKPYVGKSFKGITSDSWEAGKQNWTISFPESFKKSMQYDIVSWMPALTGRIVGSVDDTERFLWDVRKTQADLLAENYYGHFRELSHKRGLEFYAEPYGDGNFDSLQASQHLDIPMAEFWTRYIYGSDVTSMQAASAAHIYGRPIAAAEAYTAMPATSKWTDYPYSLKAEGDYFFTLGINRLTFHTFVHQPYTTGLPGMTMGPFGMHIDRNNTWTEQAYGWTNYLKRTQYVLQQGLFVADACYFKGDNPESGIPDICKILPLGYKGDVVGPDAFHLRFKIEKGNIVLPDGMSYRVCIMAPLQTILPNTLNKIKELVAAGMTLIVSSKPSKTYGHTFTDENLQKIVNELYGNLDGVLVTERNYGKGKIIWDEDIQQVFNKLSISPDFDYSTENQDAVIHYAHKKIGEDDVYFISNHRRRREKLVYSFRINGKKPELWNCETGKISELTVYEIIDGRLHIPLEMEAADAFFIVFKNRFIKKGNFSVIKDGRKLTSTKPFNKAKPNLHTDVKNDFTITLWAKPDTFAHSGRSMVFHAPEGEIVYGSGHAAMALSAGQNAVRIYERGKGNAKEVLAYHGPLEGWTYLAVVYENGKPSLYINGKLVAQNEGSGQIVHPGLATPASQEQFSSYFEGNYTTPQLLNRALRLIK